MNVTDEMVEAALDAMLGSPFCSMESALRAAFADADALTRANNAWNNVYDVSIESDGARIDNRQDAMRAALEAALLPSAADEPVAEVACNVFAEPFVKFADGSKLADHIGDKFYARPASARPIAGAGDKPVAFTVVGPDGKSSIGGWMDMRVHVAAQTWAVLREGHRYAYAYEGPTPTAATSGCCEHGAPWQGKDCWKCQPAQPEATP